MLTIEVVLAVVIAYFIGAIPFDAWLAKRRGIDLRSVGSGNHGATNVGRALGWRWAILAYGVDTLKGIVPVVVVWHILDWSTWYAALIGLMTIIGHVFPPNRATRGKGMSTASGVFLILHPLVILPAMLFWLLFYKFNKISSLASLLAVVAVVFWELLTLVLKWRVDTWPFVILSIIVMVIIVFSHRENIKRLRARKELPSQS